MVGILKLYVLNVNRSLLLAVMRKVIFKGKVVCFMAISVAFCPMCGEKVYFTAPVGPVDSIPLKCTKCGHEWDYNKG
jgi:predicted RNA-binding Zn-ribbon protein involved in translation (DUF1610 family)